MTKALSENEYILCLNKKHGEGYALVSAFTNVRAKVIFTCPVNHKHEMFASALMQRCCAICGLKRKQKPIRRVKVIQKSVGDNKVSDRVKIKDVKKIRHAYSKGLSKNIFLTPTTFHGQQ